MIPLNYFKREQCYYNRLCQNKGALVQNYITLYYHIECCL